MPASAPNGPSPTPPSADGGTAERTAPRPAAASWRLVFDDGRRVDVIGTVLFGRDPGPLLQHPGAQPVALADPSMQLSKTNTAVGVDGDALWVEDCSSTNGTTLRAADGSETDIVGRQVVQGGARVVLGGHSFVVERAP